MLVLESPIELHLNQSQKSSFIEDRQYFSLANTKVVVIWYEQHTYACKPREKKICKCNCLCKMQQTSPITREICAAHAVHYASCEGNINNSTQADKTAR